jgi:hypothetical protein
MLSATCSYAACDDGYKFMEVLRAQIRMWNFTVEGVKQDRILVPLWTVSVLAPPGQAQRRRLPNTTSVRLTAQQLAMDRAGRVFSTDADAMAVRLMPMLWLVVRNRPLCQRGRRGGGLWWQDSCTLASAGPGSIDSDSDLRVGGPGPASFGLRSSLSGYRFKVN